MIVSQAEIEFVTKGRCRRLLLPVKRGIGGGILACPLQQGDLVSLQPKQFAKGVKVTVLANPVRFTGETAELAPFITPDRDVLRDAPAAWEVSFALGNHTAFYAKHRERYLSRKGISLTTNPGQAVPGEPAVTTEEQLKIARAAREKRELEQRQDFAKRATELEQIRRESDNQKEKQLLKRTIRNLEALARGLPPDGPVQSACAVQQLDPGASTGRPHNAASSPSPEPREAA